MSGTFVDHPEYASYNWTGAPANYALTTSATNGGDSRTHSPHLTISSSEAHYDWYRARKPEQMVSVRRPGLHHRGFGHGVADGAWTRIPLLRAGKTQIRPVDDVGVHGSGVCHYVPMVFLGLLVGFLSDWTKRIHRRSEAFWPDEHAGESQPWLAAHSQSAVRFLSGT